MTGWWLCHIAFFLQHEFERIQKIQAEKQKVFSEALDMNDPKYIKKL